MEIQKLKGNTWVIEADLASVGLYIFTDRSCLLIDSGASLKQAEIVLQSLQAQGLTVHAIFNTHGHADHCGGNRYLQENTDCRIYASPIEAAFIENPLLNPFTLYGGFPPKVLQGRFFQPQPSRVTDRLEAGVVRINGREFEILDLGGHTLGHLGIRTPDDVVFAGDSLIAAEILAANPFLYLAHPAHQWLTLAKIEREAYPNFYLSHGGWQADIRALCNINRTLMVHIMDSLREILQVPRSLEEVTAAVISRQGLDINRNHYFRLSGSLAAFLAYLCNQGQAKVYTEDFRLLYRAKKPG